MFLQMAAFNLEKDIHVVGLVFYSGPDPHARAMGVSVVTDDLVIKTFLQETDIPLNKYLLQGNDLLSYARFLCLASHYLIIPPALLGLINNMLDLVLMWKKPKVDL